MVGRLDSQLMGIFDIYSKRHERKLRGDVPDVYQHDDLPNTFRTQVVNILKNLFTYEGNVLDADGWTARAP